VYFLSIQKLHSSKPSCGLSFDPPEGSARDNPYGGVPTGAESQGCEQPRRIGVLLSVSAVYTDPHQDEVEQLRRIGVLLNISVVYTDPHQNEVE
jgi:hypothetical protein